LTLAMLSALRLRLRPTLPTALVAGLFAGACILIRPVSAFALLIVPFLILGIEGPLAKRFRLLTMAGLSFVVVISIALWYNVARFGNPFMIGYDRLGHVSKVAFDGRSPKILLSLLLGPGFGLLILSPALLIAIYGIRWLWKRDRCYVVGMSHALLSCYLF